MNQSQRKILLNYAVERQSMMGNASSKTFCPPTFQPEYFGDFPKTEEDLKKRLGRKWKSSLSAIGSFYEEYKYLTSNYLDACKDFSPTSHELPTPVRNPLPSGPLLDRFAENNKPETNASHIELKNYYDFKREVPILQLSSTSGNLLSFFRKPNPRNVSRLLEQLVDLQGLAIVDGSFWFKDKDCQSPRHSYSRTYAYNKAVEKLVLSVVKKYGIPIAKKKRTMAKPKSISTNHSPDVFSKVKVSSKIYGLKCTDDECSEILWMKYGKLIEPRLEKMDAMNARLPPAEQIKFNWRIHRSPQDFITKIGIRATSEIASYKKSADGRVKDSDTTNTEHNRTTYLDKRLGCQRWIEYDVSGSIYQVSHLLTHGKWCGNGTDPYRLMCGSAFAKPTERTAYKSLCMTLYFDKTPATIVSHNRAYTPASLELHGEETLKDVIASAEEAMRRFTGSKFDSEIFLHESLLYTDFAWELRQRGITVVQVYDGFYLENGRITATDLETLMHQCAVRYFKDYSEWLESPLYDAQGASQVASTSVKRRQTKREAHRKRPAVKGE